MRTCPACGRSFTGETQFCPDDGTALVTPSRDPLVGRVIGERYRLDERLGRGAMGTVYRALHTRMEKPVAVKLLRAELAGDPEAVARFHREARSASKLDHDHIIRVTDFGQSDDGLLFLVMELLDGESLAQVVHRGALPWRQAARLCREVAQGLGHAHEQGVIHRDLKPENIILAQRSARAAVPGRAARQVVKVLDFGLAKLVHDAPGLEAAGLSRKSLTRTGVVFGTPEYMSPEQAEGTPLDHRADLYALGVLLYQMVTGEVPFTGSNFLVVITKAVQEAPVPPSQRRPDLVIPAELEALILRCMEKAPAARPQSAEEVIEALDQILARYPAEAASAPETPLLGAALPGPRLTPPSGADSAPLPQSDPRLASQALITAPQALTTAPSAPAPRLSGAPTSAPLVSESGEGGTADAPRPSAPLHAQGSSPSVLAGAPPQAPGSQVSAGLRVPQRRWPAALAVGLVLTLGVVGWQAQRRFTGPGAAGQAQEDRALQQAEALLREGRYDEALALLQKEREQRSSAQLHRLLARAYAGKDNRLRALGHAYRALQLAGEGGEATPSRLELALLLQRLGHTEDACQVVRPLLRGGAPLQQDAAALAQRCHQPPAR